MSKTRDVSNLIRSKAYILVTDKEATMAGNFRGFTGVMQLAALRNIHRHTEKMIAKLTKAGEKNGRNNVGRSKGSPNKSPKVRG